jgi:hypothetical protein
MAQQMTEETKYIEEFLFRAPLYEQVSITEDFAKAILLSHPNIDGYCYECHQMRTFVFAQGKVNYDWWARYDNDTTKTGGTLLIKCTRHQHEIYFYYRLDSGLIHKVGQDPSFADIAIDESKSYSKLLDKNDAAEFHKAIGLAAHGVGIGSYVYLRRIFERLIWTRFAAFKDAEKWDEADFKAMRMKDKIEFLKNHLPEFLIKNTKLYSILSLGVHELNEKDCLAFFPVLRQSTIWILEQDKKKKEELDQQRGLEEAISRFTASETPSGKPS